MRSGSSTSGTSTSGVVEGSLMPPASKGVQRSLQPKAKTMTPSPSPEEFQPAAFEKKFPVGSSGTPSTYGRTEPLIPPKYLFMFFSFSSGPIVHRLCAVEVPIEPISDEFPVRKLVAKDLFSFPTGRYPSNMRCAQLGSKLYLFGGDRVSYQYDEFTPVYNHPKSVYYLNTSIVHKSDPALDLLKKSSPMKTGKPHSYALVAYGKIYVIAASLRQCSYSTTEIARFEVFDGKIWETLTDPPDLGIVIGHAVVRNKVFLSLMSHRVAYFDVNSHHWGFVASSPIQDFRGVAHFINDTMYACWFGRLASFAFKGVGANDAPLFDLKGILAPKAGNSDWVPVIHPGNLIHLGGQTFCCVQSSCLGDSDDELHNEKKDLGIKLVVLQFLSPSSTDDWNFVLPAE